MFLSSESLQLTLTRLDRRSLAALAHLSTTPETAPIVHKNYELDDAELQRLRRLFLIHDTKQGIAAWPTVGTQLATWPALGLPNPSEEIPEPGGNAAENDAAEQSADTHSPGEQSNANALAAERAFTATGAIAELLFELEREPLKLLATGGLGRPGTRKLAEVLHVEEADVAPFLDIAEHAGLTARLKGTLVPSESHREWLERGPAERWVKIADAWAETHWSDIRARIGSRPSILRASLPDWLAWNYPGGRDWLPEHVTERFAEAEKLGIIADALLSEPGAALLRGAVDSATAILTAALPTPISHLYLQHDLTAVAPGPLDSHIDTRLRTMANLDGHAIASRYRFTTASVTRALSDSETETSILEFLASISLSGIPQPLEYLVTETASRHGLLRIGALTDGGANALAYVRSDDAVLLRTVLIDRNLAGLRLRADGDERLVSSCHRDQLYSVLTHAKYPVAVEDTNGRIVSAQSQSTHRAAAAPPTIAPRPHPHEALVATLRTADAEAPEDSDEAWIARQLDSAIRSKSTVMVSVRMPNGHVLDYRLEPASTSRGRLRARDAVSEIERTLPLSSIVAVVDE